MKSLLQYINEKLIINKNTKIGYKYHPSTWYELREIIEQRYKKLGPGTEQEPIDFNDVDISGMTTLYNEIKNKGIFEYSEFEYIDVSAWDVSNAKDMRNMFRNCKNLKSVGDLSNWDVSNVVDMTAMFYKCKNLESVGDLNKWDVSNVVDMFATFINSGITNIPDWYEV